MAHRLLSNTNTTSLTTLASTSLVGTPTTVPNDLIPKLIQTLQTIHTRVAELKETTKSEIEKAESRLGVKIDSYFAPTQGPSEAKLEKAVSIKVAELFYQFKFVEDVGGLFGLLESVNNQFNLTDNRMRGFCTPTFIKKVNNMIRNRRTALNRRVKKQAYQVFKKANIILPEYPTTSTSLKGEFKTECQTWSTRTKALLVAQSTEDVALEQFVKDLHMFVPRYEANI
eukprot:TRINITY_DN4761_c0_g1_i1.p1 TRINITY_DN4761_c0_g1~~TRINITY_DN4761_c0_g1_i1.p1  ORF type:complete len:227 (+),score=41.99 TRINITY_DN4761_c0_g1_i1:232-912(+)